MARSPRTSTRSARSAAPDQAQRAAQEAEKHAPVSLPSGGSFDRGQLQKGLDKVVDRTPDNREAEVGKALTSAAAGEETSRGVVNALPDHVTMRAEVQFAPGTVVGEGKDQQTLGAEVGTEFRQVFDPKKADEPILRDTASVDTASLGDGTRSEILSLERVGDQPAPPPSESESVPATDGETGEAGTTSNADAVADAIAAGQQSE